MDKIKIGDTQYILRIKAGNQNLNYTGTIFSINEHWIFIKDKFNKTLIFPIHSIISLEEIE